MRVSGGRVSASPAAACRFRDRADDGLAVRLEWERDGVGHRAESQPMRGGPRKFAVEPRG
jgi:hypothetical protein